MPMSIETVEHVTGAHGFRTPHVLQQVSHYFRIKTGDPHGLATVLSVLPLPLHYTCTDSYYLCAHYHCHYRCHLRYYSRSYSDCHLYFLLLLLRPLLTTIRAVERITFLLLLIPTTTTFTFAMNDCCKITITMATTWRLRGHSK